mgnify:CR=1 FL=1
MASAVCAEPRASSHTATILVTPAASTSAELQINKHKKKKHRRIGQHQAALVPPDSNSMCEAPDAFWPSTSVAAPCADSPAAHQLQEESEAPAASQRHCQHSRDRSACSGACSPSGQQGASAAPSRGSKAAANGDPVAAEATSSAGKSHNSSSSKPRRQAGGSPAQMAAGSAGDDDSDDADVLRRRKPAVAKGSSSTSHRPHSGRQHQHAEQAPAAEAAAPSQRGLSVEVSTAAAAQAAAAAAIAASPSQQAANGRSSPVLVNGFVRGHGPKHVQQPASPGPAVELPLQQPWQIQFGDVPVVLGSPPAQEGHGTVVEFPGSKQGGKGSRSQQQHHTEVAHLPHSSSTQSCPASSAEQHAAEERRLKSSKGSSSSLANSEPTGVPAKLQNGRIQTHPQGSGKGTSSNGKQGKAAGTAGGAAQVEQPDRSSTPQPSPKHRQRQRHAGEQLQQDDHGRGAAPSTPGRSGLTPPVSPKLSPALLKQFGLRVCPLNGCALPGDEEMRAKISKNLQVSACAVLT